MPLRFGPIRLPWPPERLPDDPYWERFLNRPLHDPDNAFGSALGKLPEGAVFPQKSEVHTPEVMSAQVKELARFLGAPLCGIVRLSAADGADTPAAGAPHHSVGIVCGLPTDHHPRQRAGMAGQVPLVQGGFVTYILAAYIRELGFHATQSGATDAAALAALAGLADAGRGGNGGSAGSGQEVYWADVIRTDLPLAADGDEALRWLPTS